MRIEVNGARLYVDVAGPSHVPAGGTLETRPTLLVVHGGPGMDHSLLKPLFLPFADHAQVIWVDLSGHGRSDSTPPDEWTLDRWAGDLLGLVDALELDRPIIAGASVGGTAAAIAAARQPDRLGALILVSTPVGYRPLEMLAAFERLGGLEARTVAARYWQSPGDDRAAADYGRLCAPLLARDPLPPEVLGRAILRPEIARRFFASDEWRELDLRDHACRIGCPVLVVSGEDDPVAPSGSARQLAERLPDGRLVSLPGCRHVLFQDAPDELGAAAIGFVRERRVAARRAA